MGEDIKSSKFTQKSLRNHSEITQKSLRNGRKWLENHLENHLENQLKFDLDIFQPHLKFARKQSEF